MKHDTHYKICKTCGNRNHPRSGQCPWCGARLRTPMDWVARLLLLLIVLVLVGLFIYSRASKNIKMPGSSRDILPALSTE